MKQPPFPFVLVALTAVMGYLALSESEAALRILCGVAALILAAAALYQSRPVREPEEPITDDDL
ncbi:hypothetical protein ACHAAC_11250 [Aeromicrobium sp. CF4.19]|uniref:hypothetical protein n=1 Tax=Aeromicrobium sp. CF4.19 TaxID=3373082 RepID=UPI003EE78465